MRIATAYRTVSESAVLVLAGTPPIELQVLEFFEVFGVVMDFELELTFPLYQWTGHL